MLWTTAELAKATGLTQRHVGYLVRIGTIKGMRVGRNWVVEDENAKDFIRSRALLDAEKEVEEPTKAE